MPGYRAAAGDGQRSKTIPTPQGSPVKDRLNGNSLNLSAGCKDKKGQVDVCSRFRYGFMIIS